MGEEVKLFGTWPSPFSFRVEWALKLKGIEYEFIHEDLKNKSQMLLQYNPVYKKIPVLVHGGKPISESALIVEYIDETWPENPLMPQDPYERARARFWAKFVDEKCIAIWAFFRSEGEEQEKAKEDAIEALKVLEEQCLGNRSKFFGGDKIGFTDIILGWIAHMLGMVEDIVGVKLVQSQNFPRLHAWMQNFVNDPVIKANLTSYDDVFAYYKRWRENHLSVSSSSSSSSSH